MIDDPPRLSMRVKVSSPELMGEMCVWVSQRQVPSVSLLAAANRGWEPSPHPRHRHTPDLHLHPFNDMQMCMMSSLLATGRNRGEIIAENNSPLRGGWGKLTVLANSTPQSMAVSTSVATRHHHLPGTGSFRWWGGRLKGLFNCVWLGEPWVHCYWLFQLRNSSEPL